MGIRAHIVLLSFYLLLGSALGERPFPDYCRYLAARGRAPVAISSQELDHFSGQVKIIATTLNSYHTVVRVMDDNGQQWVVKLHDPNTDLPRDVFSHKFVQAADVFASTEPYLIQGEEVENFLKKFKHQLPDQYQEAKISIDDNMIMTVAPYYGSARPGAMYLSGKIPNSDLFKAGTLKREEHFSQASDIFKQEVFDFMVIQHPELVDTNPEELYKIALIRSKAGDESYLNSFDLFLVERLQAIPAEIREQVADFWAINATLGIADPHPNNWMLLEDDRLLAIDLALPVRNRIQVNSDDMDVLRTNGFQMGPYSGRSEISEAEKDFMLRDVSDKAASFLSSLTLEKIREIANRADYPINSIAAENILERAKYIVQKREQLLAEVKDLDLNKLRRINKLSQNGVFDLSDIFGNRKVFRFNLGLLSNVREEVFRASIFENVFHVRTSKPKLIDGKRTKEVATTVRNRTLSELAAEKRPMDLSIASEADYIKGKNGRDLAVLEKMKIFSLAQQRVRLDGDDRKKSVTSFANHWQRLPQKIKDELLSEYQLSDPNTSAEEIFRKMLRANLLNPGSPTLEQRMAKEFDSLPTKLKQGLSKYWASCWIMRIKDCTISNWVLNGDDVYAIDLALSRKKESFLEKSSPDGHEIIEVVKGAAGKTIPFGQSPVAGIVTEDMLKVLLKNLSDEDLANFDKLSTRVLLVESRAAGEPLTLQEAVEFRQRAQNLIKATKLIRP